jgi:hypothetical protein
VAAKYKGDNGAAADAEIKAAIAYVLSSREHEAGDCGTIAPRLLP